MTRGFTLIELLVSLTIFSLVVIGIYFFFDQGQWLYLESERKSRIQEMARIAMEQMERDFRMIGAGVPTGTSDDGFSWTTPNAIIFDATVSTIAFTGDIDNGSDNLSQDVDPADASKIFIGAGNEYYPAHDVNPADGTLDTPLPIIIAANGQNWEDLTANTLDNSGSTPALVTASPVTNPPNFLAVDSTVHTLERVFYRMIDQSGAVDADGICTDPAPYCSIQRQEFPTNDPAEIDPESEAADRSWETLARNVVSLQLGYLQIDNSAASPESGAVKIGIDLTVRDRERRAGFDQNSVLRSVVLIRNRRL